MDMVETVARAIDEVLKQTHRYSDNGNGTVLIEGDVDPAEIARAAIEAMREPTKDMAQAGFAADAFRTQELRLNADFEPKAVWRAMIDAALSPTP